MFVNPRRFDDIPDVASERAQDQRRVPTQARSRERVERILDAAAEVFTEIGYDAATTEAIAVRAGTSIGSIYQFFPNKQAVYDAIAARYLERSRALFETLVSAEARKTPWKKLLGRAIDAFAASSDDPDFRAVWVNWKLSGEFLEAGQALNREFALRCEAILATQAKGLSPQRRALVATVVVEVISAMLFVAARRGGTVGPKIVDETKVVLERYLAPYTKPRAD
jgi:AcrR family transcriptional regulator